MPIYCNLNHFLVILALYTASLEYIGWYFELVNDYRIMLGYPQDGYGVQDLVYQFGS